MSLVSLINQHALSAAQAGDWVTVASTLNALTTEVRVTELRTARWLMLQLPEQVSIQNGVPITEADIVLGTLQAATHPRIKAAYDSLCNGGIDLSDQQVQDMIPLLSVAGGWPGGLAEKVMQFGRRTESVVVTTAEQCQATWEADQDDQAAQLLLARRGVMESALRQLPIDTIVGTSGLPTQQQVTTRIIEHLTTFGVTFGG